MGRKITLIIFLLFSHGVLAAKQSQIYINLSEDWQPYAGQFKHVLLESFKRLKTWQTNNTIEEGGERSIDELTALPHKGIDGIVIANLRNSESDGGWFSSDAENTEVSISLIDIKTGNLILEFVKKLERTEAPALFANLESQLPLSLRVKLNEVGSIIKKGSELVYFNLGNSAQVKEGKIYRTFKPGEKLVNAQGETFGWIEETTGIVKVSHSQSTYSTAQILLGRLSISEDDYIELAEDQVVDNYNGNIISVHENQVAINLGETVGVTEGAFYAVFKKIKDIKDDESFREKLGDIRIHSVHEDFAVGNISLSNHFSLTKALIKEGDPVEEVKPNNLDLFSLGQMGTNALSSTSSDNIPMLGYQTESQQVNGMIYRYRGGYGNDAFVSAGIMSSINHSANFFYGLDGVYLDGAGANFFLSVDIPTPLKTVKINMETGYMAGVGDAYEGFNLNINLKYPLDQLF